MHVHHDDSKDRVDTTDHPLASVAPKQGRMAKTGPHGENRAALRKQGRMAKTGSQEYESTPTRVLVMYRMKPKQPNFGVGLFLRRLP